MSINTAVQSGQNFESWLLPTTQWLTQPGSCHFALSASVSLKLEVNIRRRDLIGCQARIMALPWLLLLHQKWKICSRFRKSEMKSNSLLSFPDGECFPSYSASFAWTVFKNLYWLNIHPLAWCCIKQWVPAKWPQICLYLKMLFRDQRTPLLCCIRQASLTEMSPLSQHLS